MIMNLKIVKIINQHKNKNKTFSLVFVHINFVNKKRPEKKTIKSEEMNNLP